MLQEIPARLREHAKNKQRDVEAARQHVAGIEREALVADGIEALEARVEAAQAAVTAAGEAVAQDHRRAPAGRDRAAAGPGRGR